VPVRELMRDRVGRLAFVDALALFDGEKMPRIVTAHVGDG